MPKNTPVAVVHDFLYCYSGAERVLEQILAVFPDADLFALFDFLPPDQRGFLNGKTARSTFIQNLPFARRQHRVYLPLMPLAIEQLDLSAYEIIISSSYLAAKGVLVRPDQLHVCYCHTPVRYAWDLQHQYLRQSGLGGGIKSALTRAILHYVRNWDVRSSNGVDVFVTNSRFISKRVEKTYRRGSVTIYPPVDVESFVPPPDGERENYYVTASRLVPYKRIDLLVEAFRGLPGRRLVVVGGGPDLRKIRRSAPGNVELVGHQPFADLRRYMQRAKAFLFAAEEDFGIVAVEAQACGTPVIAFGRGGVPESVVEGCSGQLFAEQTSDAVEEAVRRFENEGVAWDAAAMHEHVQRFSAARFREEFSTLVEAEWSAFKAERSASHPPRRAHAAVQAAVPAAVPPAPGVPAPGVPGTTVAEPAFPGVFHASPMAHPGQHDRARPAEFPTPVAEPVAASAYAAAG